MSQDPLAGYSPGWRKRLQEEDKDDPLAGYTPDWRSSVIQDLSVESLLERPALGWRLPPAEEPAAPGPDPSAFGIEALLQRPEGGWRYVEEEPELAPPELQITPPPPAQAAAPPVEDRSVFGNLAAGFRAGLPGMGRVAIGEGLETVGELTGIEGLLRRGQAMSERGAEVMQENQQQVSFQDLTEGGGLEDWADWASWAAGQAVGSTLAPLVGGLIGGGAGFAAGGPVGAAAGGLAGAIGPSYAMMHGELRQALEEEGVTGDEASKWAIPGAIPLALLEVAPIGRLASPLFKGARREATGGLARRIAKETAKQMVAEGSTEGLQTFGEQNIVKGATGQQLNLTREDVWEIVEGITAGMVGGAGFGAVSGLATKPAAAQEPKAAPIRDYLSPGGGVLRDPGVAGIPAEAAARGAPPTLSPEVPQPGETVMVQGARTQMDIETGQAIDVPEMVQARVVRVTPNGELEIRGRNRRGVDVSGIYRPDDPRIERLEAPPSEEERATARERLGIEGTGPEAVIEPPVEGATEPGVEAPPVSGPRTPEQIGADFARQQRGQDVGYDVGAAIDALTPEEKSRSFQANMEENQRLNSERQEGIYQQIEEAYGPGWRDVREPIELQSRGGRITVIHTDPTTKKVRATRFDQHGPSGHDLYDTVEEAIQETEQYFGVEGVAPGTLDPLAQTDQFNQGVKASFQIQRENARGVEPEAEPTTVTPPTDTEATAAGVSLKEQARSHKKVGDETYTVLGYDILDENGEMIGDVSLTVGPDGTARIGDIKAGGAGSLGARQVARIRDSLQEMNPEITAFEGGRVGGTRGAASPATAGGEARVATPATRGSGPSSRSAIEPAATGRRERTVFPGDGSKVETEYVLVDASELTPSHDPFTFERQPEDRFPPEIQGRAYHGERGRAARQDVIQKTNQFDVDMALDETSSADGGVSVVTPDGTAVAGNQRIMMLQRLQRERPDVYRQYLQRLREKADRFGIDPAQVQEGKVLVRRITDETVDTADLDTLRRLNAASDAPRGKTKDVLSEAATKADQLKSAGNALRHFGQTIGEDQTIRAYLETKDGRTFIRELVSDGVFTEGERAKFVDAKLGTPTDEGKLAIERIMRSAAIGDPDLVGRAPASALRKLDSALPAIVQASQVEGFDISPVLRGALDVLASARANGITVTDQLGQADMLAGAPDPEVESMARFLDAAKKNDVTQAFREYAEDAAVYRRMSQSEDLFGQEPAGADEARARRFPSEVAALQFRQGPIKAAAVRFSDGHVSEGASHIDAIVKRADELGVNMDSAVEFDRLIREVEDRGFVDHSDSWLSRAEARELAVASGQTQAPTLPGHIRSEDLRDTDDIAALSANREPETVLERRIMEEQDPDRFLETVYQDPDVAEAEESSVQPNDPEDTWNQNNPAFLEAYQELERERPNLSKEEYKDRYKALVEETFEGGWDAPTERQQQRGDWIAVLEQNNGWSDPAEAEEEGGYLGEVATERQAVLVMGPPAAGKSALANPLQQHYRAMLIDSDEMKKRIPEFDGGKNAGGVHEESSELIGVLQANAMARGENIVVPMVGKSAGSIEEAIADLRAAGYDIHLIMNELPIVTAARRAYVRFKEKQRYVSFNYILGAVQDNPDRNFQAFKNRPEVTSFQRYSNDVPFGQKPILLERSENAPALPGLPTEVGQPGRVGSRPRTEPGGPARAGADQEGGRAREGRAPPSAPRHPREAEAVAARGTAPLATEQADLFSQPSIPEGAMAELVALYRDAEAKEDRWGGVREHERSRRTAGLSSAAIRAQRKFQNRLKEVAGTDDTQALINLRTQVARAADPEFDAVARGNAARSGEDTLPLAAEVQDDLFGGPSEVVGGEEQRGLELEEPSDRGMTAAVRKARQTVSLLEGKVARGHASQAEVSMYEDARSLLRRNESMDAGEVARRARETEEKRPHYDDTGDLFALEVDQPGGALREKLESIMADLEAQHPGLSGFALRQWQQSHEAMTNLLERAARTDPGTKQAKQVASNLSDTWWRIAPAMQGRYAGLLERAFEHLDADPSYLEDVARWRRQNESDPTPPADPGAATEGAAALTPGEQGGRFEIEDVRDVGSQAIPTMSGSSKDARDAQWLLATAMQEHYYGDTPRPVGANEPNDVSSIVKDEDGNVIGALGFKPAGTTVDFDVAVAPEARGQGIAAQLIRHAERLRDEHFPGFKIELSIMEPGLAPLLRRLGYTVEPNWRGEPDKVARKPGREGAEATPYHPVPDLRGEALDAEIARLQEYVDIHQPQMHRYGGSDKREVQGEIDRLERLKDHRDRIQAGEDPAAPTHPRRGPEPTSPLDPGWAVAEAEGAALASDRLPDSSPYDQVQDPETGEWVQVAASDKPAPRRADIQQGIIDAFDVALRTGLPRRFRGALGIFKARSRVVRLDTHGDIPTLAHELGHHTQQLFFPEEGGRITNQALEVLPDEMVSELEGMAEGISDQTLREGWAEFWRRYVDNPEVLPDRAPKLLGYVQSRLDQEFPDIRDALEVGAHEWRQHREAGFRSRLDSQISVDEPSPSRPASWSSFRKNWLDKFEPIKRAVDKLTEGQPVEGEDAAMLTRLMSGYTGIAQHFLERGQLRFTDGETIGPSLRQILEPVVHDLAEFRRYMVSKRALELHGRDIESGVRPEDARAQVQEVEQNGDPEFVRAFSLLQDYQDNLLRYLVESGVMSLKTYKAIKSENMDYVPMFRLMDEATGGGMSGIFGHLFQPVKRIHGSGRPVIDPLESIVRNTFQYAQLAARQEVSMALARLAERQGAGQQLEAVDTPIRRIQFKLGEIEQELEGIIGPRRLQEIRDEADRLYRQATQGMSKEEIEAAGIQKYDPAEELLSIFRPGDLFNKPNIISVTVNGQRQYYEVDPELFEAVQGLEVEHVPMLVKWLSVPQRMLRAGATLAPEFQFRNPLRDQLMAAVQSQYGYTPFVDLAKGVFHLIKKDDTYWKWKQSGGERSSLLTLDRNALQESMSSLLRSGGLNNVVMSEVEAARAFGDAMKELLHFRLRASAQKGFESFQWAINPLAMASSLMEDATRVAEFANALEVEGDTRHGRQLAGFASREISTDFARHGAKTAVLRSLTAFWNARLQGYDRLARAAKHDPAGFAGKAFAYITLPTLLELAINFDDEEYWEHPQWQRDLFWMFRIGDQWVRIPKPFELGLVFGTVPARIAEWAWRDDPEAAGKFLRESVGKEMWGFVPFPTAALPVIENITDYSFFLGRSLTPQAQQNILPQYRYGGHTSEVAKLMGRMAGVSPRDVDNLLYGYTGGLGRLFTGGIDKAAEVAGIRPESESRGLAGIPGLRGVLAPPPGFQSESVNRLYDRYSEGKEIQATVRDLEKRGEPEEAGRILSDPRNVDLMTAAHAPGSAKGRYEAATSQINDLRKQVDLIRRDPGMSRDEKRVAIERLGEQARLIAQDALGR